MSGDLLFRVVGTADQWAGFDMGEAECHPLFFQHGKLAGIVEACNRQMLSGGLEVLADGHDVAADGAEIAHDFSGFVYGLSHPKDQPGLCAHAHLFYLAE